MFINITDSETADNKGSSNVLIHYLDKENRLGQPAPELWFNTGQQAIRSHEAQLALDHNVAKLMHTDAKFFLVNISPSQKEITWLKTQYGDEAEAQLKSYAVKVMDEYARNFKRPGIESSKDLLWFGKLEHYRYYSHKDAEVKNGLKKRGDRKLGEQMHIQVIVSRKDITNTVKLSPMNKSRGRNTEHSRKVGQFDRSAFKQMGETLFDKQFSFERGLAETFQYANAQKKGTLEERIKLRQAVAKAGAKPRQQATSIKMVPSLAKYQPGAAPSVTKPKKRKKKGQDTDNDLIL
ncbi:DUF5712 family protein [Mucilaginibacter rubeus]|uniref:Molybdopterin-guanine dinucleotide biosynthesis protein MobB n=1 Tax=Mucilaginibacter rubeus TaxID=2027860 RepID=A0A5C1HTD8_9SPHI|nr:DUF5712 family protein [Mucilaginibacter rubeus]QEM09096.1 molybdopterin-guanine dinucleotide biosynthesis protein MobB [Mucilaginibacter rubeus]